MVVVAAAVASVAVYAYVALSRMSFPYDLEWIEGAVLQHVERAEAGQALYTTPSLDFTALLYAPLYYYVCAAFGSLFEVDLSLLRAVSFAASIGAMALAYVLVRRETASRAAGVVAAGLFAACYDLSGGWLDLARVDSLFLLFLMAALVVARSARGRWGAVGAAVLLVLATYTKQQAAVAVPAIFLFFLLGRRDRTLAVTFGAVATVGLVGVYLAADLASDGWFSYYFLELAGQHPWATQYIRLFFTDDLWPLTPALALCGLVVWRWWKEDQRERLFFYVPLGLAIAGGSYLSRVHEGGYPNVVLPTYLFIAVLAAIALGTAFEARRALPLVVPLAFVVQFALLAYNPGDYIPSDAEEARSDRAVAVIGALEGDVYVPSYPIYARRAGRPTYVHTAAALDILRADDGAAQRRFKERYEGMIRDGCFAHVVASDWPKDHYRPERAVLPGERVEAISGLPVPLGQVYVRRRPASPGADCPARTAAGRTARGLDLGAMSLLERVKTDTATAMKAGERERVTALRMITAELQRAHKEAAGSETDEVAVLQRERKRRLESADAYREAGRDDLAGSEHREAELISEYLPEQMSDDELAAIVGDVVAETGAASPKEMGRVMSMVMPRVQGRADGKRVSALVKERLT